MRKMHKSTRAAILITLILLILWFASSILMVFQPVLLSTTGPSWYEFRIHKLFLAYRLFLPSGARQLFDSLPPEILEADWLRPYTPDDFFWITYGLPADQATPSYFAGLLSRDLDELSSQEIRHLMGYLIKENTAARLENRIYEEIQAQYFSSTSQMVSFSSNWRDYSQYDQFLAVDDLYLEKMYEQLDSGSLCNAATGVPLELYALRAIEDLPSWAQDPGCSLTRKQTLRLIRLANESGTYIKTLLPQLRRNARAHGLMLREDLTTPVMNIKAAYIEEKFRQMGLLD